MNKYKQVFYYYIVLFQVYRKDTVITIIKKNKEVFKICFVYFQFDQDRGPTSSLNIVIFVFFFLGSKHVSEAID